MYIKETIHYHKMYTMETVYTILLHCYIQYMLHIYTHFVIVYKTCIVLAIICCK